ncbi:MAG TPA: redoxin domain-containing protein [Chondromyces sp.]|nr:redoxin domain-containing protein [Chondromyces sp.]
MKKNWVGIALLLLLVGIAVANIVNDRREISEIENKGLVASGAEGAPVEATGLATGEKAPDFELKTLDGQTVSLSDYKGKKVILNFWATWCPPCKEEMPHMQKFYEEQAEEKNVEILAVNLTSSDKSVGHVREFVKSYGLTFPVPLDEEGTIGSQYSAITIPTSYLLNTDGTIGEKVIGPMDEEMLEMLVDQLN